MMAIAAQKRRYGYRRIHVLLQRDGCFVNHKRIWRLYSKAGLSVRSGDASVSRLSSARRYHYQRARIRVGRWTSFLTGWPMVGGFDT